MKNLLYKKNEYKVYEINGSLVVVNTEGEYRNHAHLTKHVDKRGKIKLSTAKTLIDIVIKRRVPKSDYLVTSAIRLTLDEDYKHNLERILDKRKSKKYINSSKGIRK